MKTLGSEIEPSRLKNMEKVEKNMIMFSVVLAITHFGLLALKRNGRLG